MSKSSLVTIVQDSRIQEVRRYVSNVSEFPRLRSRALRLLDEIEIDLIKPTNKEAKK